MDQSENRFIQKYALPIPLPPSNARLCLLIGIYILLYMIICYKIWDCVQCTRLPLAYIHFKGRTYTQTHDGFGVYRLYGWYKDTGYNSKRSHVRQKQTSSSRSTTTKTIFQHVLWTKIFVCMLLTICAR